MKIGVALTTLTSACAAAACAGLPKPPPVQEMHVAAGFQYLYEGQCELAEERCRLALEYNERFPRGHNCLGLVALTCDNDPGRAAEHFKAALALDDDFAQAHNNLGTSFLRQVPSNYPAACEEFEAALAIDPGYLDARENLGICLERRGTIAGDLGNSGERREYYRRARSQLIRLLEMDPLRANAQAHLGLMELVEGHADAAAARFTRCLELAPGRAACAYNLGNAALAQARCDRAIPAFIAALRPEHPHARGGGSDFDAAAIASAARTNLAAAYEMCAKKDGAYAMFLEQIKSDPGNPDHHFDLARIYAEKGLYTEAINEWENTLRLEPRYCPAYFELAMRADAVLDTRTTVEMCHTFIACEGERAHDVGESSGGARVERCRSLVKSLDPGDAPPIHSENPDEFAHWR